MAKGADDFDAWARRFRKAFGDGTLPEAVIGQYDVIPTGSLALDFALGVGGYVCGRQVEIWGVDGVGKTTMALTACAEAQKARPDKRVGWIDMEQALDLQWAVDHGVDLDRFQPYIPQSSEDVADALKSFLKSGLFSMVVVDSIGSFISKQEQEKDADEAVVMKNAQIITRMVRIAAVEARLSNTAVLYLNQVRASMSYGSDITTPGGFALKHCTTHKLKLSRVGGAGASAIHTIEENGEKVPVGHEIRIKIERNRVAPPSRVADVVLFNRPSSFGPVGIDSIDEIASMGINFRVIQRSGGWYTLPVTGERVQGKDAVKDVLRNDPDICQHIREEILAFAAKDVYPEEQVEQEEGEEDSGDEEG